MEWYLDSPSLAPYGPRTHPVTGQPGKLHGGIDVGTPTGTPLALNAPGEILAAGNYGGYGFMQDVWIPSHNIQLRLAHLSEFVKRSGEFAAGEVISKTGGAAGSLVLVHLVDLTYTLRQTLERTLVLMVDQVTLLLMPSFDCLGSGSIINTN